MAMSLSGRAASPVAVVARLPRGGGSPQATPRVDLDALAEAVFEASDRGEKARLFVAYLRALGLTGEVSLAEVEERYWEIAGCVADWQPVWLSMSRALGRELVKRQRRVAGRRRQVVVIPVIASVQ